MTIDPARADVDGAPASDANAERLEALRRRLPVAGSAPHPSTRRRHAAAGARIVAVGLSTGTAIALIATMARAATPITTTAPNVSTSPPRGVVILVGPTSGAPTSAVASRVADAPMLTATRAAPVTTSQSSPSR